MEVAGLSEDEAEGGANASGGQRTSTDAIAEGDRALDGTHDAAAREIVTDQATEGSTGDPGEPREMTGFLGVRLVGLIALALKTHLVLGNVIRLNGRLRVARLKVGVDWIGFSWFVISWNDSLCSQNHGRQL